MNPQDRDRLLRSAWELAPFEDDVERLSEIARTIGPAQPSAERPSDLPYTLRGLAEAARRTSRARGGGATVWPGTVVLRRAPRALRLLARRLPRCVLVSGTNGKTTTASMIAAILREAGHAVTHNRAGANVPAGVATALLEEPGEVGVFEVDEAWLPIMAAELLPSVIVLSNLFRDRLDAYGEVDAVATAWEAMLAGGLQPHLVLNADDAAICGLGSIGSAAGRPRVSFFGIEDHGARLSGAEHTADAIRCRRCDAPLSFEIRLLSHLGHHRCERCGAGRPKPVIRATDLRFDGISGSAFTIESASGRLGLHLRLPGLYNVYNALAAAGAALALGVEPDPVSRALASFAPVFGRGERVRAGTTDLIVLLMKNPAGTNELLRTLSREPAPFLDLLIALNDGPADGRDVSWIWDADFEGIRGRTGQVICSGRRAAELALRLKYAGWPVSRISVEPEIATGLDRGIAQARERLIVLPTYSALLELHAELAARGLVAPFWAPLPDGVCAGDAT